MSVLSIYSYSIGGKIVWFLYEARIVLVHDDWLSFPLVHYYDDALRIFAASNENEKWFPLNDVHGELEKNQLRFTIISERASKAL